MNLLARSRDRNAPIILAVVGRLEGLSRRHFSVATAEVLFFHAVQQAAAKYTMLQ